MNSNLKQKGHSTESKSDITQQIKATITQLHQVTLKFIPQTEKLLGAEKVKKHNPNFDPDNFTVEALGLLMGNAHNLYELTNEAEVHEKDEIANIFEQMIDLGSKLFGLYKNRTSNAQSSISAETKIIDSHYEMRDPFDIAQAEYELGNKNIQDEHYQTALLCFRNAKDALEQNGLPLDLLPDLTRQIEFLIAITPATSEGISYQYESNFDSKHNTSVVRPPNSPVSTSRRDSTTTIKPGTQLTGDSKENHGINIQVLNKNFLNALAKHLNIYLGESSERIICFPSYNKNHSDLIKQMELEKIQLLSVVNLQKMLVLLLKNNALTPEKTHRLFYLAAIILIHVEQSSQLQAFQLLIFGRILLDYFSKLAGDSLPENLQKASHDISIAYSQSLKLLKTSERAQLFQWINQLEQELISHIPDLLAEAITSRKNDFSDNNLETLPAVHPSPIRGKQAPSQQLSIDLIDEDEPGVGNNTPTASPKPA